MSNGEDKWDAKFDAFKKDILKLMGQQVPHSNGMVPSNNQCYNGNRSRNNHGFQNRGQDNYRRPNYDRGHRGGWTGNRNGNYSSGYRFQGRNRNFEGDRKFEDHRRSNRESDQGQRPRQEDEVFNAETALNVPGNEVQTVQESSKTKKVYLNPLIPKECRISKIWTSEEAEVFKGKFGTNAEQQYLRQYMSFSIDEAQSNANRCACELIINSIPKFFGTYAQNEEHDLRESIRILKVADSQFKGTEIHHVQRHPGQEKTESDFIRVTVLFSNLHTPDRIATKAEEQRDSTIFQRSITKGLREKNKTMDAYIYNLNLLRPKNSAYLWSSVMIRGEKHKIQRSDPTFVLVPETPAEVETPKETDAPKKGVKGAIQALKEVNIKLASTGPETPMENIPGLTVEDTIEELKVKHGGNMTLACQELLLMQGVPDRKHMRSMSRNHSNVPKS